MILNEFILDLNHVLPLRHINKFTYYYYKYNISISKKCIPKSITTVVNKFDIVKLVITSKISKYFTDKELKELCLLEYLECNDAMDLTDEGIQGLTNLIDLNCGNNEKFTDKGIQYLRNLTHLRCGYNTNFTDQVFLYLPELTHLDCGYNKNFTIKGVQRLSRLTHLNRGMNSNLRHWVSTRSYSNLGHDRLLSEYMPKLLSYRFS